MKASGGKYAALAALTNIPAMLFAALLYEIFLTDSSRGAIYITVYLRAYQSFFVPDSYAQRADGIHDWASKASRTAWRTPS